MQKKPTAGQKRRAKFEAALASTYGLVPDQWGNYKFTSTITGSLCRIKCQDSVYRFETKLGDRWIRRFSNSYRLGTEGLDKYLTNFDKLKECVE